MMIFQWMSGCHAQGIIQELNQGMFQDKTFIHLYNEKVKTLKLSIKVMNGVKSSEVRVIKYIIILMLY